MYISIISSNDPHYELLQFNLYSIKMFSVISARSEALNGSCLHPENPIREKQTKALPLILSKWTTMPTTNCRHQRWNSLASNEYYNYEISA